MQARLIFGNSNSRKNNFMVSLQNCTDNSKSKRMPICYIFGYQDRAVITHT